MARTAVLAANLSTIAALANAQSANPSIGHNPKAQGATDAVALSSGRNGADSWFNIGLTGSGWQPPFLDFTYLYHINRPQFYSGAGKNCKQYDSYFQKAGDSRGIDPTILAFIAMQESSCNAIQDNVDAGANYLRCQLDTTGGNAVEAIVAYNGWFRGMTKSYPCSAQGKANGLPQNLDYLHETLNGWFTGQDPYGDQYWIGTYNCQGSCNGRNVY